MIPDMGQSKGETVRRSSQSVVAVAASLRSPSRFPLQAAAASSVAKPNHRQSFHASGAAIASEPPNAMELVIDAQAFKKDQSAVALAGNHYAPQFRPHG